MIAQRTDNSNRSIVGNTNYTLSNWYILSIPLKEYHIHVNQMDFNMYEEGKVTRMKYDDYDLEKFTKYLIYRLICEILLDAKETGEPKITRQMFLVGLADFNFFCWSISFAPFKDQVLYTKFVKSYILISKPVHEFYRSGIGISNTFYY